MRGALRLSVALALALLAGSGQARADLFGPISLVSESNTQQAEVAMGSAISGDGRFVVFEGSFAGLQGIFRRELATGIVEEVAADAQSPSISDDGRYVSFTTTAALDPVHDLNSVPDVYVRDMSVPLPASGSCDASGPCAFTLVSAVNGSADGLSYESAGGSLASGRSAISADGRHVAFVTTAVSDLAGPNTPASEVAVRDLDSQRTRLVSVTYELSTGRPALDPATGEDEPVAGGAVYGSGASISADGSTVAWMGIDVGAQAAVLPGESLPNQYTEPLWRRIADGSGAPTRRITGGSDALDPACIASGESALPTTPSLSDPCMGPFAISGSGLFPGIWTGGIGDYVPQLSADGFTVAFLSEAKLVTSGGDFGEDSENRSSDVYVVDMHEGLSRTQALRPLTELAGGNSQDLTTNAPIVDLGISPDGTQIAFTTQRTRFPLGSPTYVSAPSAIAGLGELFEVDLLDDTLTRVTHGFQGGPSEHPYPPEMGRPGDDPYEKSDGASSPSFSDRGDLLAFTSTASNLVYGDGNTPTPHSDEGSGADSFVVPRLSISGEPGLQYVASAPEGPSSLPDWRLGVTALARPDGSLLIYVQAPAAGSLRATAESPVVVLAGRQSRAARRLLRARRRARARRSSTSGIVATRRVAATAAATSGQTLTTLTLAPLPVYRTLAARSGGLSATVTVTFSAPGRPLLRESIPAAFVYKTIARTRLRRHARTRAHRSRARP